MSARKLTRRQTEGRRASDAVVQGGAQRVAAKSTAQWAFASVLVAAALQFIGYGLRVIAECWWSCTAISTLDHWSLPDFGADDLIVTIVAMWFVAPVLEELPFRKILFTFAAKRLSKGAAVGGVSLLFALCHADYWAHPEYWPHGIVILMSGVVYQLLYVAHGCVWVSIACHMAFNVLAVVPRPPPGPVLSDWGLVGMGTQVLLISFFAFLAFRLVAACQWLWTTHAAS